MQETYETSTGAKGSADAMQHRYDLIDLGVLKALAHQAAILSDVNGEPNPVYSHHEPDDADPRPDLRSDLADFRLDTVLGYGAKFYDERNWEKGIPIPVLLNHVIGHIVEHLSGDRSEDHLGHAMCRIMMAVHFDEMDRRAPGSYQSLLDGGKQ